MSYVFSPFSDHEVEKLRVKAFHIFCTTVGGGKKACIKRSFFLWVNSLKLQAFA